MSNPMLGWIVAVCFAGTFLVAICWMLSLVVRNEVRNATERLRLTKLLGETQIELEKMKSEVAAAPKQGRRPSREGDVYNNLNHSQLHVEKLLISQTAKLDRMSNLMRRIDRDIIEANHQDMGELYAELSVVISQFTAELAETKEVYSTLLSNQEPKRPTRIIKKSDNQAG